MEEKECQHPASVNKSTSKTELNPAGERNIKNTQIYSPFLSLDAGPLFYVLF